MMAFDGLDATTVWADGRIERFFVGGLTQREGRLELHVGLGGALVVARVNVPELPNGTASISDGLGGAPAVVYLHQGVGQGPTVVTDASGAVLEERVFEPYGTPLWVDADYELERLGWNGKVVDPSTGWSDHGARWHATRFARWLSVDPPLKGPGGLVEHGLIATPYGFVAGNPVMFWDPDGREWRFEPNERAFRNPIKRNAFTARFRVSPEDGQQAALLGKLDAIASDNASWHGSDPLNGEDHVRSQLLDQGLLSCDEENRCVSTVMDSEFGAKVLADESLRAIYEDSKAEESGSILVGKLINTGLLFFGARLPRGPLGGTALPRAIDMGRLLDQPLSLWGRSADDIAQAFTDAGYSAVVRQSVRGSGNARIVEISGHPTISQIQVHAGGGVHGGAYVKVSTSTQGKLKIVDRRTYRPHPQDRATIISIPE